MTPVSVATTIDKSGPNLQLALQLLVNKTTIAHSLNSVFITTLGVYIPLGLWPLGIFTPWVVSNKSHYSMKECAIIVCYLQTEETAMGTKMAPAYANLFMGKLEEKLKEFGKQHNSIMLWKRFIDDFFCHLDRIHIRIHSI